jgi:hypothetical protein
MPNTSITGGCACGGLRYELMAEPMFVHACHCLLCQRQTGGAFIIHAMIETDRLRVLSGAPYSHELPTGSGGSHTIYRCPECQVAVFSDYGNQPWERLVKVGTFDDPSRIKPNAHIFIRSKLPWISLPPDVPSFDEFYDLPNLWPRSSYKRKLAAQESYERLHKAQ